ncbi:hypothetical protein AVEN_201531-1 [Araneus ventricosus]|uniref:Uncharacterized protein n=1 Tax=Araneus ventricosus TaxID=182803 RepID=A0A4Y2W118_ARAVE|nr:hypothetical protein AVEN_201531-1 [Araneus ventricosus]
MSVPWVDPFRWRVVTGTCFAPLLIEGATSNTTWAGLGKTPSKSQGQIRAARVQSGGPWTSALGEARWGRSNLRSGLTLPAPPPHFRLARSGAAVGPAHEKGSLLLPGGSRRRVNLRCWRLGSAVVRSSGLRTADQFSQPLVPFEARANVKPRQGIAYGSASRPVGGPFGLGAGRQAGG